MMQRVAESIRSLGAVHDGLNNNCSKDDSYIMTASTRAVNERTVVQRFRFSACSMEEIQRMLDGTEDG